MNEKTPQEKNGVDKKKARTEQEFNRNDFLSPEEIDALGEIGNISIGTSATTISKLLNRRVRITTPTVYVTDKERLIIEHPIPYVAVEVLYTKGLEGKNLLIIKTDDVLLITDLLTGGDGKNVSGEIEELHLSTISEVMNQMMGTSATSLSEIVNKKIIISPPKPFVVLFDEDTTEKLFKDNDIIVKISFVLEVEGVLKSELMLLMPIDFSKKLVDYLMKKFLTDEKQDNSGKTIKANKTEEKDVVKEDMKEEEIKVFDYQEEQKKEVTSDNNSIDVQPAVFPVFDDDNQKQYKGKSETDIGFISDVPLQVSVELGRTKKPIKEILLLNKGSIIELDKTNGEPVDIIVNGKIIAKGEVVVIDENFGVRITEIERRL